MAPEQDETRSTWQSDDSNVDNIWDAASGYGAAPPGQNMQSQVSAQAGSDQDDSDVDEEEPDVRTSSFFSVESLRNLARQISPVLVPLPFALLIFLFTFVAGLR